MEPVGLEIVLEAVVEALEAFKFEAWETTVCSVAAPLFEVVGVAVVAPVEVVVAAVNEAVTGFKVCAVEPVPLVSELPVLDVE